jgi:cysteine-rich repeat protein
LGAGNGQVGSQCSNACDVRKCGNGTTEADLAEECDDGNTDNNDSCTNTCRILEHSYQPPEPAYACNTLTGNCEEADSGFSDVSQCAPTCHAVLKVLESSSESSDSQGSASSDSSSSPCGPQIIAQKPPEPPQGTFTWILWKLQDLIGFSTWTTSAPPCPTARTVDCCRADGTPADPGGTGRATPRECASYGGIGNLRKCSEFNVQMMIVDRDHDGDTDGNAENDDLGDCVKKVFCSSTAGSLCTPLSGGSTVPVTTSAGSMPSC